MSGSQRLAGKRVLVTGAGTGIGQGIAVVCAREGARVAIHYSHSDQGAKETCAAIEKVGGKGEMFKADFADVAQVKKLAGWALETLGGVDVLVNNAGITFNSPISQVTPVQFDQMFNVNVRAGYFLAQGVLDSLKTNRGSIINLTSIHAYEGFQEHSLYAATKGAIVAMTRAMAVELAPQGVRVNAIAPGAVPVENHTKATGKSDPDFGRNIPIGYVGTPEDIGAAVVFLASQDGKYIVGQTLVIDGGTTSWMPFGEQFRAPLTSAGVQFGKDYMPGA